ncbi:MAG: N-6 DNA methylase [Bacteroidales bacterium]|nr:N-6 DNA methylase [Bacteroidales bacterium]
MTLHEAIEKVLKEAGKPLSAREIADKINEKKLYFRGDREPVPSSQIHARVKNYPAWFMKTGNGLISLSSDRQDQFNDVLNQVLDDLHSPFLQDISYLVIILFFYKRWLDYPSMLTEYRMKIDINRSEYLNPDIFRSFYEQLKVQLAEKKKNFDTEVLDTLFSDNQDLFRESVSALGKALKSLNKFLLSEKSYTVKEFGRRFSELFTGSFANIRKTGEYSTPDSLSKLMINLANNGSDGIVYNPAAGYFTFPAALQRTAEHKIRFYGEELNTRAYSLGLLNLMANGASIENAYQADSITSSELPDESADVIICNPPFNLKADYGRYDKFYPFKSKDIILYFLQLALRKLKPGGEVIMVIPENILFTEGGSLMQFRKYLIEHNLVDSVISLPPGTFEPYSMVKSSILILKKDRPFNDIIFFDADNSNYYSRDIKNKFVLNAGLISRHFSIYNNSRDKTASAGSVFSQATQIFEEEGAGYDVPEKNYVITTNEDVRANDFCLDVKRYFFSDLSNIVRENGTERIGELNTILEPYHNRVTTCGESGLSYLSVSNLNADYTRFPFDGFSRLRNDAKLRGMLIDCDILMVNSISENLKPTFFKYTDRKILVSQEILAFIPDTYKIDPEYLVYELSGDNVNKQVKLLSRGATIRRIRSKDFLKIRIRLPKLAEQLKIVNAKKEALVQTHIKETVSLAERLKVSAINERKMLGAFKHELSPLASSLKGNIQTLGKFLHRKIEEDKVPQMTDKVSAATLSRDLKGLLSDMINSADNLLGLTESISQILDVTREDITYENVYIKKFIKEQVAKWEHKNIYNIVFHGEENEAPDVECALNRDQFALLVRNFLENTNKHGYTNRTDKYDLSELTGPSRNIVFNAFRQEESIIIEMINDGDPFPADFTFEDFVNFGGRGGSAKGSGIGGFLMKKIVDNHRGDFKLIESGRSLTIPRNIKTGGNWPSAVQQIRAGIYFRIILHEKYF